VSPAKALRIDIGEHEDAATTFARDQVAMLACASDGNARLRLWKRPEPGLLLGRFHRAAAASKGLSRRLSGGRIVPVGPGILCLTMVAPTVDWFDPAGASLRPDQVLNRALRPLLTLLRERRRGIDAYYPGRDIVTAAGRALAHASFTVMRDGVAVVDVQVGETGSFAQLPPLLDRFDPTGVAGVDRGAFDASLSLVEASASRVSPSASRPGAEEARGLDEWGVDFAATTSKDFGCDATVASGEEFPTAILADQGAARDFLEEPGPPPGDHALRSAASVSMLGMVECVGRMRGDRVTGLRLTGDLLAPFHTLDDISAECENEPLRPADIRKALARALAQPRSFVLGVRDLDELILRLAP
jgi:hypothetical protein